MGRDQIFLLWEKEKKPTTTQKHRQKTCTICSQTLKTARMPYNSHDNLGFLLVLRCALNYEQQQKNNKKNPTEKSNTEITAEFKRDTYVLYTSSSALVPLSAAL